MTTFAQRGAALALLILTLAAPMIPAQAEPFVALHVNMDAWNQGFPQSRMAQCWVDPAVQQWRDTTLQRQLDRIKGEGGLDLSELLPHLVGEIALAVMPPEAAAPGAPLPPPAIALGIRQPGQMDALLDLIASHLTSEEQASLEATMLRVGDTVAFGNDNALNQHVTTALAEGATGLGLSTSPGSFINGRIDIAAILGFAGEEMDPQERAVLEDIGLSNVTALEFSSRFHGEGLVADAALDFNGPRTGLMNLIGEPRALGLLDLLPPDAMSATGMCFPPLTEIFDWIQSMVERHGGPTALQDFQAGQMAFQGMTGVDLRTQLLPALGQEGGLVIGGPGGMGAEGAVIIEVRDRTVTDQFINAAVQMANMTLGMQMMTAEPGQTPPAQFIQPATVTHGDITYTTLMVPGIPIQICHGYVGDHLVIATSQTQMNAICDAVSTGQTLTSTPDFSAVAAEMPAEASLVSYSDNRQSMQGVAQVLMPMMLMAGGDVPPEAMQLLGQLQALAPHMGHKGTVLTAEPTRLTIHTFNTSGAEMIAGLMALSVVMEANQAAPSAPPPPPAPVM